MDVVHCLNDPLHAGLVGGVLSERLAVMPSGKIGDVPMYLWAAIARSGHGGRRFRYIRSSAICRPLPTESSSWSASDPRRRDSFARSSVVTWWQRATESESRPPLPEGSGTAVGPLRFWAPEVDSGTTMTDRQSRT